MSNVFDVFAGTEITPNPNPYERIGYPANPFREAVENQMGDSGPFYSQHIHEQIQDVRRWMLDEDARINSKPLALVGNIGAGKTRILRFLKKAIEDSPNRKNLSATILLSDTGFARASVGGAIISSLETLQIRWLPNPHTGVIPLVWAIVSSQVKIINNSSPLRSALMLAQEAQGKTRVELAILITRWLQREQLSNADAQRIGLRRRLDWEGELIKIIAELVKVASEVGELRTLFLFFDQIEDLFRPVFSDLRRSRMLTDLRGLIDEVNDGAPIGILLAWTPDFGTAFTRTNALVERLFRQSYEALYSRLQQRRVTLNLLKFQDAEPFAQEWINVWKKEPGFNLQKQPNLAGLVSEAWKSLLEKRQLLPGEIATPRDLLSSLADQVDNLAKPADGRL